MADVYRKGLLKGFLRVLIVLMPKIKPSFLLSFLKSPSSLWAAAREAVDLIGSPSAARVASSAGPPSCRSSRPHKRRRRSCPRRSRPLRKAARLVEKGRLCFLRGWWGQWLEQKEKNVQS